MRTVSLPGVSQFCLVSGEGQFSKDAALSSFFDRKYAKSHSSGIAAFIEKQASIVYQPSCIRLSRVHSFCKSIAVQCSAVLIFCHLNNRIPELAMQFCLNRLTKRKSRDAQRGFECNRLVSSIDELPPVCL